jgi:hypothetical protein
MVTSEASPESFTKKTTDDPVTLIAGTGKTLTARVIDTAGNVTALTLSDNGYTLDIVKPTATAVAVTANNNLLKIGDTVIVTLTTDKIVNVIKGDDANTPLPAISFKVLVPFAVSLFVPAVIPPVVSVSPGITVYSNTKEFEPAIFLK